MTHPRVQLITSRMVTAHGWHADRIIPNVVSRFYETAVGPRQASVWFTARSSSGSVCFLPEYYSEGRNAVESHFTWVTDDMTDEQVLQLVDKFVKDLDAGVAQTYAARLHPLGVLA